MRAQLIVAFAFLVACGPPPPSGSGNGGSNGGSSAQQDAVEAMVEANPSLRGGSVPKAATQAAAPSQHDKMANDVANVTIAALLRDGKKINAIKANVDHYGVDLKTAKEAIEAMEAAGATPLYARSAKEATSKRAKRFAQDPNQARFIPSGAQKKCFPASALVLTPSGEHRIDSVDVGDSVLSMGRSGPVVRRVLRVDRHGADTVVEIRLQGRQRPLRATPGHCIAKADGRWRRVGDLRPGDRLRGLDGDLIVESVAAGGDDEALLNIITEGEHSAIIDGVVASNFAVMPGIQGLVYRLLIDRALGRATALACGSS